MMGIRLDGWKGGYGNWNMLPLLFIFSGVDMKMDVGGQLRLEMGYHFG
jgi:hypothetical protein